MVMADSGTVLVAGGTGAIGKAVARRIIGEGGRVTLIGRRPPTDPEVARVVAFLSGPVKDDAQYRQCDVRDRDSVRKVVADCPRLHAAVFAAGVTAPGSLLHATHHELTEMMSINALGLMNFTLEAGAAMMAAGGGSIVTIGSWVEVSLDADNVIYSASKAAGTVFTRGLALALAPTVRANVVTVGIVGDEGMAARHLASERGPALARRIAGIPLGSLANSADVARAVCFLISSEASYVTGSTLFVDGGASVGQAPEERRQRGTVGMGP